MKLLILALVLMGILPAFAAEETQGTGTAVIDERDMKALETKREPPQKFEKEGKADEREEEEVIDDPFIDNTGNSETTNRPVND